MLVVIIDTLTATATSPAAAVPMVTAVAAPITTIMFLEHATTIGEYETTYICFIALHESSNVVCPPTIFQCYN
jgi:hypothetical protein